jgi:hypothetical protein
MNSTFSIEPMMFIKNSTTITIERWFIPFDILLIVCSTLVIILSILFLFIIVLDKTCHTVSMMLVANSCIIAFTSGCNLLSLCIFTLENDLKQVQSQDSLCVFRAYLNYVSGALFFSSFLLQALYRYVIIVYRNYLFLQSFLFQFLVICLSWIYGIICPFPFIFTNEIIYNVDNQICQLPLRLSFSIIFVAFCVYFIPISLIMFIYLKLVRYVKQMSKRVTRLNTLSRTQRELKMVRRTVILVTILITVCFPYALFILMSFFNRAPKYHFRIAYLFVNASLLSVMIVLFQFTNALKTSIMKRIKQQSNMVVVRM